MHNELGKSLAFAGLILLFNQGAAIIGNLVGGVLFDKISAYKTVVIGTIIALISSIFLAFYHSILPYSIFLVLIGFGAGMTRPVLFAMAGSVWPEGGRRAFNAIYVAQNLGVAIGAASGGYIANISFDYIFVANAIMFSVFFTVVLVTFKSMDKERNRQMSTSVIEQSKKITNKSSFVALLILCSGFLLTWVAYSQWQSTISSHTQDIGIPLDLYSTLWTINGGLIVLGQPLIKWITSYITTQKMQIYVGNTILMFSFVVAMFAENFSMFAIAMAILTFGEMLVWPAVPTLANDLAPKGRAGFYQGFVNSVAAGGRMTGPLVGGLIVDLYNIQLLFFVILGLLLIPFITTRIFDRGVQTETADAS